MYSTITKVIFKRTMWEQWKCHDEGMACYHFKQTLFLSFFVFVSCCHTRVRMTPSLCANEKRLIRFQAWKPQLIKRINYKTWLVRSNSHVYSTISDKKTGTPRL